MEKATASTDVEETLSDCLRESVSGVVVVCANGRLRGSGGRVSAEENETDCLRASDGLENCHGRGLYHVHRLERRCRARGVVVTGVFCC